MLLHAGQGHVKFGGKVGDRSVRAYKLFQDPTPGGIGKRSEPGIENGFFILNHMVQYIAGRHDVQGLSGKRSYLQIREPGVNALRNGRWSSCADFRIVLRTVLLDASWNCWGLNHMRLSLTINGKRQTIASLTEQGYLSAHLNMSNRPKESEQSKKIRVVGFDTSNEYETVKMEWPELNLETGDVVELEILPDGNGDQPTVLRSSAESPNNLLSSPELARQVLVAVQEFESRLLTLLSESEKSEPAPEHKKFHLAVGRVMSDLDERLLSPVYRRHSELLPDALKNELL